jgi:asparagine synthase (glutamine-hydrolysing)
MCGFLGGLCQTDEISSYIPSLEEGFHAIRHRGPDASHSQVFDGKLYFGHKRLSIIDLSSGADQPFKSHNANAWILFNGEIYNYKELRTELAETVEFKTHSDTEVLLEGYLQEGTSFFKKLRGIFAFAILDKRQNSQRLILARDHAGIKPLYYFYKDGLFLFSSEIKGILPALRGKLTPNYEVLRTYVHLTYCLEPHTAYREIQALEPGHFLIVHERGLTKKAFLKYDFTAGKNGKYLDHVDETQKTLLQAVQRNLTADVEVSIALSGGIDSSLVYAIAVGQLGQNVGGITVKFSDQEYDESNQALAYAQALKGRLEVVDLRENFNLDILNKLLLQFDQPYADTSLIPVYYLTKASAKHSKVLLGGDGGDELYLGYPSQMRLAYLSRLYEVDFLRRAAFQGLEVLKSVRNGSNKREFTRLQDLISTNLDGMIFDIYSWLPRHTKINGESVFLYDTDQCFQFYNQVFAEERPEAFTDRVTWTHFRKELLSDYLRKTEIMSMYNSVEYRVPLLDEDLTRVAFRIPFHKKATLGRSKQMLREIHSSYYKEIGNNAKKHGFSIPLDMYLKPEEWRHIQSVLLDPSSFVNEFVKPAYTSFLFEVLFQKVYAEDQISRGSVYQRIIMLYALHLWAENKI